MKVKRCKVVLEFDVYENMDVNDVPDIIEEAIERSGYALSSGPEVVEINEIEEE